MVEILDYIVIFVINYVLKDSIKTTLNHKIILITIVKNNNSNNLVYINMSYHCECCDEAVKLQSKTKHFKSLTPKQYENFYGLNHNFKSLKFFDVGKIFNNYVTNHNRKLELYLVRAGFKIDFDNFASRIQTDFHYNISLINLKQKILYWIDYFNETGYIFSHIIEMNIETISDKRNMSYNYYIKQPKHTVEIKLNQISARNPHLINALDRAVSHPLLGNFSHVPFNN